MIGLVHEQHAAVAGHGLGDRYELTQIKHRSGGTGRIRQANQTWRFRRQSREERVEVENRSLRRRPIVHHDLAGAVDTPVDVVHGIGGFEAQDGITRRDECIEDRSDSAVRSPGDDDHRRIDADVIRQQVVETGQLRIGRQNPGVQPREQACHQVGHRRIAIFVLVQPEERRVPL